MSERVQQVTIHTDGGCLGNPGPGGWAVVLECEGHKKELSGGEPATTNNRMELLGAIRALEALKRPCAIEFYTDSTYVRDGITKWVHSWKVRGWKTASKEPVKNEDLWRALDAAASKHKITWRWLKGHAGHEHNERCDQLANIEMAKIRKQFTPAQLKASVDAFQKNRGPAAPQPALFSRDV